MRVKRLKPVQPEPNPEPPKQLLVDEEEFTGVIRNLVNSPPANEGIIRRKKNPETDPRKIRLFNLDGMRGRGKTR